MKVSNIQLLLSLSTENIFSQFAVYITAGNIIINILNYVFPN